MDGEQIKAWRTGAGLSRARLAMLLGLADEQAVARWEKGQASCSGPAHVLMLMLIGDESGIIRDKLAEIAGRSLR